MLLPPLVFDLEQVLGNIAAFNEALDRVPFKNRAQHPLIRVIPFMKSWYATPHGDGHRFGPSKFVGHVGLDAESYGELHARLDGRLTERRLAQWAQPVGNDHPEYAELKNELSRFCGRFLLSPNLRARIALLDPPQKVPEAPPTIGDAAHVTAVLTLVARMPPMAQQEIRRRLGPI